MKSMIRTLRDSFLPVRQQRRRLVTNESSLACESLEIRQLLSATGFMVDRGVLEFHGSDTDIEAVSLKLNDAETQIQASVDTGDGPQTTAFDVSDVDHFRFVGQQMADSLSNETPLQTEVIMSHGHHGHRMLAEMEAMLDLVRYGDVTHTPVQSGKWLDADTWGGSSKMPGNGARVLIPSGTNIVVNGEVDASLMTVRVDGTLKFAHWKDSELRVDTMIVGMNGQLVMGTESRPIRSQYTAKLIIDDANGGIETTDTESPDYDPFQLGNGLISHGQVTIYGAAKTSSATLATEPSVGDMTLTFDTVPVDWNIGDSLVIAGTSSDADGDEVREITAINATTNVVTLNAELTKNHHTPEHTRDGLELKVHVANTTRNAIIQTAAEHRAATGSVTVPTGDTAANRTGRVFKNRGHIMFMHSNNVNINNAGFYHLGRTNKMIPVHDTTTNHHGHIAQIGLNPRARYAVHFHRAGTSTTPARVVSSAVVNTPGWGFVNHSSHADFVDSVAYDAVGAGFVTEAGDEAGSFVGNVSIRNHGSGVPMSRRDSVDDFGHGGHGFWFQGTGITVEDNVASGSIDTGIVMWPIGIDGLGDTVRNIKVKAFTDNTIYGSDVGFLVGQHEDVNSEFVDTTIFGVRHGLEFFYPENLIYRGTTVVGDVDNPQNIGIKMHHRAGPFEFHDTHVEGFERGFETPRDNTGNLVEDVYLNNVENFAMINGRRHFATEVKITGGVEFGSLTAKALDGRTPYNFVMEESESAADIARFNHLVLPYQVILDYDGLDSPYRLYFKAEQAADHVVWPVSAFDGITPHRSNSDTPEELRGKTNTELKEIFEDMTAAERIEMLSRENRFVYQDYPESYYAFAGGIRPSDSEVTFPEDSKNAAFEALLPADNLVLNMNFDDGTATDVAPDAHDNSGNAAASVSIDGGAATFDGTGGIEIAGSAAIDNMVVQQRSISLSFATTDVSSRQILFEEGGASRGLNIYIDGGRLYVGAWDRPAGFDGTFLSTAITANEPHSVALILNADNSLKPAALRGFLNGTQFGSGLAKQINGHASGTALGAVNGKTRFHDGVSLSNALHGFTGTLDSFRIYNKAVDNKEISWLHKLRLLDAVFAE